MLVAMQKIHKLGVICDLHPNSGLGHFNRMSFLSGELNKLGVECVFLFESKLKEYLKKFQIKKKIIFYGEHSESLHEIFLKNNISSLIIDSYKSNYKFENSIKKLGLKIIAIDDHLKKHAANIVFTNKPLSERKYLNTKKQIWFMGPEFAIFPNKKNKKKNSDKVKKILLHAGGSGLFNLIMELTICTINLAKSNDINITVLCPTIKSEKIIKGLLMNNNINKNVKIIPYIKNLISEMHKYDVVVGPSGTSTFETIFSKSLPFTVQLKNDNRDSLNSWHSLGHFMHLSFDEKKDLNIIDLSWKLIFENKTCLSNILYRNSKMIDGNGAFRVAKKINDFLNNNLLFEVDKNSNIDSCLQTLECSFYEMRRFLSLRNQKSVRYASTNPSHIISWPEHVNWWIKDDVRRFTIKQNNKVIGFHWIKLNKDKKGKFITSGWFLEDEIKNKLKIADQVLKIQSRTVKENYKNLDWIIIMRNNNKFVKKININAGFKSPKKLSIDRAISNFAIKEVDYNIMEMCL